VIKIFVIPYPILSARRGGKNYLKSQVDKWIQEEWLNGFIIEILRIKNYVKLENNNQYWDFEYRAWEDKEYKELNERVQIGL